MLAALVTYVAPTLDRPLLEKHAFRQTQTAFPARIFHEEGIDLLHPRTPVLGEPFEIPFEFPLLQAAAAVVMDLGVAKDRALRVTALACFLATAALLYGLMRHVAGRVTALASLAAFVFTPLALVWSRASMIEYLATAGAVGFAWAVIAWREQRRPLWGGLALAAGLVGMLVKPTTAVFWIAPALAYRPAGAPEGGDRRRVRIVTALLVAVPLLAALLWTRHADAVKAASAASAPLTSSALSEWNFGPLGQRFDLDAWDVIGRRLGNVVTVTAPLLAVALVALWRSRQRLFWLGVASAAVLPLLVFTNLYVAHDYYFVALTPAIAALIGLGAGFVWNLLPRRPEVLVAAVTAGLVLVYGTLELGRGYWLRIHGSEDDPQVLPLAAELESRTKPMDLVAVVGLEWSPAVLYYAHRRGLMVVPGNEDVSYDLIYAEDYRHLLVATQRADLGFLSRWRWVGAIGPHTYSMADTRAQLAPSQLVVTDAAPVAGRPLVARPFRIPCHRPVSIPSGERGTWIRFGRLDADVRISASDDLAPLPARRLAFAAPELARSGQLTISCSGARSMPVVEVVAAPSPR